MHDFMRAVGFSSLNRRKDLDRLIEYVLSSPTERHITPLGVDGSMVQIDKSFGENFGITVVGEYDEEDNFHFDHCFPYCKGNYLTAEEDVNMKKLSDREAYAGYCEDYHIGCMLIFFLQNVSDYIRSCWSNVAHSNQTEVRLGALAVEGTILLGVRSSPLSYFERTYRTEKRRQLMMDARNGNQEAMDSLTVQDMDMYSVLGKRLVHEDVFSIVDSSFMPYGVECDQYAVVGLILAIRQYVNSYTQEEIWTLTLDCNGMNLDVCINSKDLYGEPMVGRRFKGVLWLQGYVSF